MADHPHRNHRWTRHLAPERSLGLRLSLAAAGAILVLVPFSVLTMLVVTAWAPLRGLDERLGGTMHAVSTANPAWATVMRVWTETFGPGPLRILVAAVAVWLWYRGAHRVAVWAAVTMVAGGLLGAALKLLFGRHRPEFLDPVAHAAGSSFPSGHALTAALAAGVLLLVFLPFADHRRAGRWLLAGAAAAVVVVTGLSRISLGVHWLSDVLAGWALGAAVVAATAEAFATWRDPASRRRRTPAGATVFDESAHPQA